MPRPIVRTARRQALPTAAPRTPSPDLDRAVERLLDGDASAFADVYRALSPRVFGVLLRLTRERALAQELTQETFLRMYQARRDCRRGVDITPWAFAIARHLFCDQVRRARLRRFAPGEAGDYERTLPANVPSPDEELAARRMARAVEEVLAALPEGQAEAFRMAREDGQTLDEVAARLGRTELSVRLSVHRARTAIREHLASRWEVSA